MSSRIRDSYLSGSYSRDTAIAPLDDVDIIFVIDPKPWQDWLESIANSRPNPQKVLDSFANAIRYRYKDSTVYMQRRSVCLQLNHLDVDVVPAIEQFNDSRYIHIPDTQNGGWIKTAPKVHGEIATEINKKRNGRFKPLVKLLKYWNGNLPEPARFKSFAIETIAVKTFQYAEFESLEAGLVDFFDLIAYISGNKTVRKWQGDFGMSLGYWSTEVMDAAGTGCNTVAGVDDERKSKFIEQALRSRERMLNAEKARWDETARDWIRQALKM